MLPAVGQGAVGIECRANDERVMALLAAIDDGRTNRCVAAERAMLAVLDGSCHTPIAGFVEESGGRITLRALVAKPDGSVCLRTSRDGAVAHAITMARDAGEELRGRMGAGFYD